MIYLLHYDRPLHHAQHYLGSCNDPQRIQDHGTGTSRARLPEVFHQLGVQFIVARTWEGGRTGERKLKNHKNARVLCPICRTKKLTVRAAQQRARRATRQQRLGSPPGAASFAALRHKEAPGDKEGKTESLTAHLLFSDWLNSRPDTAMAVHGMQSPFEDRVKNPCTISTLKGVFAFHVLQLVENVFGRH